MSRGRGVAERRRAGGVPDDVQIRGVQAVLEDVPLNEAHGQPPVGVGSECEDVAPGAVEVTLQVGPGVIRPYEPEGCVSVEYPGEPIYLEQPIDADYGAGARAGNEILG